MARPITGAYAKPALLTESITEFLVGIGQVIELKIIAISAALNRHMRKYLGYFMWMKILITVGIAILRLCVLTVGQSWLKKEYAGSRVI